MSEKFEESINSDYSLSIELDDDLMKKLTMAANRSNQTKEEWIMTMLNESLSK